jgi:hypothetical protein
VVSESNVLTRIVEHQLPRNDLAIDAQLLLHELVIYQQNLHDLAIYPQQRFVLVTLVLETCYYWVSWERLQSTS